MRLLLAATLVAALALATPHRAQAVEIDFGTPLLDADNQPIKDGDKLLTLGRAAFVALMSPLPDEQALPPEEKMRKGALALRVYLNQPLDLGIEDVALIKKYIGKSYGSLVIVRAFPLIDPPPKK